MTDERKFNKWMSELLFFATSRGYTDVDREDCMWLLYFNDGLSVADVLNIEFKVNDE